ncbi:MAG TPA: alpha/beta fold hydrolase [Solirubrobacteraceae bacterium]|jgi:pimeloyl-ACP methyl ester carboxylesterase
MAPSEPIPELPGVTHRRVRAGDLELHVAEAGDPAAPPVMLVHGWPQHWWMWRFVIGELARTHRVICPDLRGHGWSDAPRGDYAKATLAGDLLALLDTLELDEVRYMGHDWGAWVGYLLAGRAPERITRLLALSIAPPWFRPRVGPQTVLFASYQFLVSTPILGQAVLRTAPAVVDQLIRTATVNRAPFDDDTVRAYSRLLQDPDRAAATTALYRTFLLRELPRRGGMEPPAVPHKLVVGAGDPIRAAVHLGPGDAQFVSGAGHFLPEEDPQAVLAAAREFLLA